MLFYLTAVAYPLLAWYLVKRESKIRLATAFLVAPLAPCLLIGATEGVIGLVLSPFSYMFSFAGVPVYFLFRRLGWLKIWHIVPASALLGGAAALAFGFGGFSLDKDVQNIYGALTFAGYGALTGFVFWIIAFGGQRTNNSFNPTPNGAA